MRYEQFVERDSPELGIVSADVEDGDVERVPAEIGDDNGLVAGFVHVALLPDVVSECSRGGLMDELEDRDAGVSGGGAELVALVVGEVGRDGEDCPSDGVPEEGFGGAADVAQVFTRDLLDTEGDGLLVI
ncbi:hypothetical protein BC936DRAFT_145061 [Jimgerdemannia flammicorona]|uniref:Uncharacterized protein n=1 Tax=Jimgerdemannia flammicorona TaxID=994334 RepID=A0A433DB13_9FUNG|nr:hypothetical protein BC936DRAFT_145061 [Jimgerdemannia flammicorona]